MVKINFEQVKDYQLYSIIYQIHNIKDKLSFFEKKYNKNFQEFEEEIKSNSEENFEKWDDYIQWKAYIKSYQKLNSEREDILNGNYQFS
ncbi:MAG: hypothetical protein N2319_05555 [Candidatus Kapabacteria bacterium]|nr:hypothetical protein [Candidatus Kapabacteria bacterium]